jgi:hypothetical protein
VAQIKAVMLREHAPSQDFPFAALDRVAPMSSDPR